MRYIGFNGVAHKLWIKQNWNISRKGIDKMRIDLDLLVSLRIDVYEGTIINPCDLISSGGELSVELVGHYGLTQITLFNEKPGYFDHVYIVGDSLDIEYIRPQLLRYVKDNHSQIENIEVVLNDSYYQLIGDPVRDIKKSIQMALDENN